MATFAFAHYVLRMHGFFGASSSNQAELWSTGMRLGLEDSAPVSTTADQVAFLEAISGAVSTFHTSPSVRSGTNTFLSELTLARVGTDGKYDPADRETTRRAYSPVIAGTTSPLLPWSGANVVGLRTKYPRGIASNGRTYWPTIGAAVDSGTGRLGSAVAAAYAAAAKVLIDALNTAASTHLSPGTRVIVAGQTGQKGPARNAFVTQVRIDDRLDAIERRENDVVPHYSFATISS